MRGRKKLLFGAVATSLLIGGWEVTARVAGVAECRGVEPDPGNWEEMLGSTRTLWEMRPNYTIPSPVGRATQINAVGLRDTLLPAASGGRPKRDNERRIITTGDSSVYGWGVPTGETYQEKLERLLTARWPNIQFEVINLGVPGYSTEQSLRQLEDVGWSYDPDLLVVSNIFSDSNFDSFHDHEALALVNPDLSGMSGFLRGSRSYCGLYMLRANSQARAGQQPNRVLMPGTPRDARWVTEPDRFGVDARVPLGRFQENLGLMLEGARENGAAMMLAPLAQEWDAGRWSMMEVEQPSVGTALPWTPYRDVVSQFASDNGLVHVPFYEAFAASNRPAERLFSDAIHPTPDGAEIMARELFAAIVRSPSLLELPSP